jgi:hypothetical protein
MSVPGSRAWRSSSTMWTCTKRLSLGSLRRAPINKYWNLGKSTVLPDGRALVIELTFLSRRLVTKGERLEHRPLPIPGLDAPNIAHEVDEPVMFVTAGSLLAGNSDDLRDGPGSR